MRLTIPTLALASAAALLAGAFLSAAADPDRAKKGGEDRKVIVTPGPDAAGSGRARSDAAKERVEREVRSAGAAGEGGRPVDRLLEHIKRSDPGEHERLVALRRENPEAFQQALRRKLGQGRLREGAGSRTERPVNTEAATAERMGRVDGLAEEYRRARGEEREKLRARIRENIGEVYDTRERDRTRRIRQMEEELVHMKKEIENRRELRDKIIDRKVGELLGEDPTAW